MPRRRRRAFSLIELVMVVMIIALVGAIAIPRLSRGSAGAAASALSADLEAMNKAVDLYAAEHGGNFPDLASIESQLTQFTDSNGGVSGASDSTHLFGPYLRTIPPLPIGARKGNSSIAAADAVGVGWIYDPASGLVTANTASGTIVSSGGVHAGGGAAVRGGGTLDGADGGQ